MPRQLHVEPHYSVSELKKRYRASREPVESRRWHLIWLVSDRHSLVSAAKVVGLNYDYARDIVRAYNARGPEGLRNRRKDSRPKRRSNALLNPQQIESLKRRLQTPPEDGGMWSGPKVARQMAQMTGRDRVWPQRGWDYLKLLGYSCQQPRPRHAKSEPDAQAVFKKTPAAQS